MSNNINKIVDLHGKIARRFKQYELAIGEHPPFPVLNEMRYALRAVVLLLGSTHGLVAPNDDDDELNQDNAEERAMHALLCAYHDLADGLLIDIVSYMTRFTKEFTEASIIILGERRGEILDLIEEVENIMVKSRDNGLKRPEIYETEIYEDYFEKLLQCKKLIEKDLLPEIISLHQELERKKHRDEEQGF
ncbi:MAG: hypothetical protein ACXWT4_17845 [Methylobacter sp.]